MPQRHDGHPGHASGPVGRKRDDIHKSNHTDTYLKKILLSVVTAGYWHAYLQEGWVLAEVWLQIGAVHDIDFAKNRKFQWKIRKFVSRFLKSFVLINLSENYRNTLFLFFYSCELSVKNHLVSSARVLRRPALQKDKILFEDKNNTSVWIHHQKAGFYEILMIKTQESELF